MVHGSWFTERPLTAHWACKGQMGCAIPLGTPAGRNNWIVKALREKTLSAGVFEAQMTVWWLNRPN